MHTWHHYFESTTSFIHVCYNTCDVTHFFVRNMSGVVWFGLRRSCKRFTRGINGVGLPMGQVTCMNMSDHKSEKDVLLQIRNLLGRAENPPDGTVVNDLRVYINTHVCVVRQEQGQERKRARAEGREDRNETDRHKMREDR